MDSPAPINVIQPEPQHKIKFGQLIIIVLTLVLAVAAAVGAWIFYQNRNKPSVAPTAPPSAKASTTTPIPGDFSSSTWTLTQPTAGTITKSGSTIVGAVTSGVGYAYYNQQTTGDFSLQVTVSNIGTNGTGGAIEYSDANLSNGAMLTWNRTGAESFVWLSGLPAVQGATLQKITVPQSTNSVTLKLQRIGSTVQGFVDSGSGFNLVDTLSYSGDGFVRLDASGNATFSNFIGQANLVGIPTPVPGSSAACALTFTVLDLTATGTPTPTPTITPTPPPGSTPTPTPTPGPTNTPTPGPTTTPTPQPTPASCSNSCSTNADCASGLICTGNACRNPQCTNATNCTCAVNTPTPTPVTLQTAGDATPTWILGIGGTVLVGLGAILFLAI